MNIFNFTSDFNSEESCRTHFKEERDKLGVTCKRCLHTVHYWIKSQWSYECKKCRSRTSLRSGTIMQSSNLSFLTWYKAMFLLTATKKGFSSKEIQRQLGLKRYEPVWAMVHKLRKAMGSKGASEGEMDKGYFAIETSGHKCKSKKVELVSSAKSVVVESNISEGLEVEKVVCKCRYFRLKELVSYKVNVDGSVKNIIDQEQIIGFSNQSNSYINIADYVEIHMGEKTTKEVRKWDIEISNAKRNFVGNYHKIKKKYLQLYLNEFVYKLNCNFFEKKVFDRLVIASITKL